MQLAPRTSKRRKAKEEEQQQSDPHLARQHQHQRQCQPASFIFPNLIRWDDGPLEQAIVPITENSTENRRNLGFPAKANRAQTSFVSRRRHAAPGFPTQARIHSCPPRVCQLGPCCVDPAGRAGSQQSSGSDIRVRQVPLCTKSAPSGHLICSRNFWPFAALPHCHDGQAYQTGFRFHRILRPIASPSDQQAVPCPPSWTAPLVATTEAHPANQLHRTASAGFFLAVGPPAAPVYRS